MDKPTRKSRVFVGSSVESLPYAYAVQENLDPHDAEVKVWPQGIFQIASYTLDSLLEAMKSHDFGVFLFAADDIVSMHNRSQPAVRDNVLFELGLFMGGLGRERTFVIAPLGMDLRLPSDLLGWNIAFYDPHREDHTAALGVACNKIRQAIRRLGSRFPDPPTPGTPPPEIVSAPAPLESFPGFAAISPPEIPVEIVIPIDPPGYRTERVDQNPSGQPNDSPDDDWYEVRIDTIPDF